MAECTGGKGPCRFDCAEQRQAPPDARNHQPGEEITETGQGDGQSLGRVATDAVGAESTVPRRPRLVSSSVLPVTIRCAVGAMWGASCAAWRSASGSSRSRIIPAMASGPWRPGSSSPIIGLQC